MGRPNPISTIIKNWRKTIFIVPAFSAALYYSYDYTLTTSLMRASCKQVSRLGEEKLHNFNGETRHITVILNPVAGKRKAKKLYTKWIEPLLHLSGIKVSVIETETPNQACELMKVMSNCDGVAIVGGDGTVNEVITGLLSRPDCSRASQNFPLSILPVGQYNSIARMIYGDLKYRNYKEFLILSTLNLIESKTEKFDVIKIESQTNGSSDHVDTAKQEPIYSLRDLRYGKYQDCYYKSTGFMIFQEYIKPYWLRFRRAFGNYNKPKIESISYTEPCSGCSTCYEKHKLRDSQRNTLDNGGPQSNKRWWTGLVGFSKQVKQVKSSDELEELSWAKRENLNCDKWLEIKKVGSISEVRACMMNEKKIRLSIARDGEYHPSEVIEVQDINLNVSPELDKKLHEPEEEDEKKKVDDMMDKFFVDRKPIKARSINVTTLSKAVRIYTKKSLAREYGILE